ncbi:hypothetical protein RRG08_026268 [Elysia crispata]|uniref:Uncharacterized protein n=1 Tax=Elysia crispata TaxID=231223 RepID=A0AAE0ZAL0_9GAST|nr:hypothetical protein RRG08_026268 [Elysia crispata]
MSLTSITGTADQFKNSRQDILVKIKPCNLSLSVNTVGASDNQARKSDNPPGRTSARTADPPGFMMSTLTTRELGEKREPTFL